jgi:hypothetical protein
MKCCRYDARKNGFCGTQNNRQLNFEISTQNVNNIFWDINKAIRINIDPYIPDGFYIDKIIEQKDSDKYDIVLEQAVNKIGGGEWTVDIICQKFRKIIELGIAPHLPNLPLTFTNYARNSPNFSKVCELTSKEQGLCLIEFLPYDRKISTVGETDIPGRPKFPSIYANNNSITIRITMPSPVGIMAKEYIIESKSSFYDTDYGESISKKILDSFKDYFSDVKVEFVIYGLNICKLRIMLTCLPSQIDEILRIEIVTSGIQRKTNINFGYDFTKLDNNYIFKQNGNVFTSESPLFINTFFCNKIKIYKFNTQNILHEFMHMLGFIHTHQLFTDNPIKDYNRKLIHDNYYRDIPIDSVQFVDKFDANYKSDDRYNNFMNFDIKSIMTYELDCGMITDPPNFEIKKNYKLSNYDKIYLTKAYSQRPIVSFSQKTNTITTINFINKYTFIYIILCIITCFAIYKLL